MSGWAPCRLVLKYSDSLGWLLLSALHCICTALQGDILLVDLKLRPDSLSVLELPLEVLTTLLYCV